MNELQLQARSRNRVSSRHKAINRHVCNTRKSIFSRRRQLIASDTQHLTRVTHHHTHAQLNGVSGNGRSKENFVQVTGSVYIYQPLKYDTPYSLGISCQELVEKAKAVVSRTNGRVAPRWCAAITCREHVSTVDNVGTTTVGLEKQTHQLRKAKGRHS